MPPRQAMVVAPEIEVEIEIPPTLWRSLYGRQLREIRKLICEFRVIGGYFLRGTFAPFLRASESPIAIACFLLFTLLVPFFPDFNVPCFRLRIALLTLFWAALPYFRGIE